MSPPFRGDNLRKVNRYVHHPKGNRLCSRCQTIKALTKENFGIKRYYRDNEGSVINIGLDPECSECMVRRRLERTKEIKADYRRYCRSKLLAQLRHRAKACNVPFNLTADDLIAQWEEQGGNCWYTSAKLDLSLVGDGKGPHRYFPSIDRRDPAEGYVKGNIAWMTYCINRMKNDLKEQEFIEFCSLITRRFDCTTQE